MNFPNGICAVFFWIFISLFVIASTLNILCGFFEKEKARKISKPFCMAFLVAAAFCACPEEELLILAVTMGLVGDIILIWKDSKLCVALGTMSFLLGHLCYIGEMLTLIARTGFFAQNPHALPIIVAAVIAFMFAMIYPMYRLTNHSPVFTVGGIFYSTILCTVGGIAIFGCAVGLMPYFLLIVAGDLCFILSDSTLAFTIFIHDIKRRDFYIMLTYLLAQGLIFFGFVLTLLK